MPYQAICWLLQAGVTNTDRKHLLTGVCEFFSELTSSNSLFSCLSALFVAPEHDKRLLEAFTTNYFQCFIKTSFKQFLRITTPNSYTKTCKVRVNCERKEDKNGAKHSFNMSRKYTSKLVNSENYCNRKSEINSKCASVNK